MVRETAASKQITLRTRTIEAPDTIRADLRKIRQILYNLLSNAVKFTPPEGRIEIAARLVDPKDGCIADCVEIAVSDTGIGIAQPDINRLFQPFEQIDRSPSGTGLGLALSKRLVELHGGRIWAESEGPGKGASFHLTLPMRR